MAQDNFLHRHIGVSDYQIETMLEVIGVKSVEALMQQVVPDDIRLQQPLDLPAQGMSEAEFAAHIESLAAKNRRCRSFIGMGYYPTWTPAAILRNVFENPAWYTSYTPYQAEISQGRLEALLNFQSAIISLTGLPVAGCSLLDEATAAAEAMTMMLALRSREQVAKGANVLLVDENIFPQTLDVLLTRAEPLGIEIVSEPFDAYKFTGAEFGAIVQFPAANGAVRDYEDFAATAHAFGVKVTAVADPIALALYRSPGEWGADIAVGSTQRMGIPMGFGGPSAGYMATREEFKRSMPGRIIGISTDRLGRPALRMALQTREQHIKREKATSNICTAQALLATMAGLWAVYHGAEGLKRIAMHIYGHATAMAVALDAMGFELTGENFFDTIQVAAPAAKVRQEAEKAGINFYYPDEEHVRMSFDELTTHDELVQIASIFAAATGRKVPRLIAVDRDATPAAGLLRSEGLLTQQIFRAYRCETDLMRYIKRLEHRDFSLADGMIPLGSCTMKLNAAATMLPLSLAGFGQIHPFAPADQAAGYMELIDNLSGDLCTITGLAACSLQPNSGAAGEYAGLMVVRAYHQSRGQGYRNVALIPASAHGTNPASAAMAGMKIVVVATDPQGNIDLDDLRARAAEHADTLSCLMVTYPSTHGVFEGRIRQIVDIVHDAGGQVYMDGANMNAQVGLTSPGAIGADLCHLNLHKTFASPHGGGGPGVGPICVAAHLAEFLPSHPVVETGGSEGITAVAAAPFGSASILPIAYGYIKMLGESGLRRATEIAILNANYMASALKDDYRTFYTGEGGRVGHEMILDLQHFRAQYGVETGDVARRLMDYGFHAPTLSFPVHDTFMVEPTESEPKAEMDRFIEAMRTIKKECEHRPELLRNAPHPAAEIASDNWAHPYTRNTAAFPLSWVRERKFFPYVSKIDAGFGDRNLVCAWEE